jgi:hypothetical protein
VVAHGERVLILTHRREILNQTSRKLSFGFYAATELAPGAAEIAVLKQSQPTMNKSRSELAKAKQAAKALLKKGKPSHAA